MVDFNSDENALLALLPADGSTMGNGKAREVLGWEEARYNATDRKSVV